MEAASIHIIDDDKPFRKAMARLLMASGYKVEAYENAGEFLMSDIQPAPGCILLDYSMPGPNGLKLQEALSGSTLGLPIIFISGLANIPTAVQAIKAGAIDFLPKPVDHQTLLSRIRIAIQFYHQQQVEKLEAEAQAARANRLTAREREVLQLVVEGKSNKVIANSIGACERTVKAHRAHVMEKLQAKTLPDLVKIALKMEYSKQG